MKDWRYFRSALHATYNGGHEGKELTAFHHGMDTVINAIEEQYRDKCLFDAAPDLFRACKTLIDWSLEGQEEGMLGRALLQAMVAVRKSISEADAGEEE